MNDNRIISHFIIPQINKYYLASVGAKALICVLTSTMAKGLSPKK